MNARRRRVHAPEDDQLRFGVVLIRDRRHLAVERHVGGAGRRRADRARQARGAEAAPQLGVEVVLRQQAVRAAVRVGQDGFAARFSLGALHLVRDELERFVPRGALELALALAPRADRRIEQAIRTVHALAELPDLRADVAVGDRILARSVDRDDLAVLHGDGEAARIGTIERTGGFDDRRRPAKRHVPLARICGERHGGMINSSAPGFRVQVAERDACVSLLMW